MSRFVVYAATVDEDEGRTHWQAIRAFDAVSDAQAFIDADSSGSGAYDGYRISATNERAAIELGLHHERLWDDYLSAPLPA